MSIASKVSEKYREAGAFGVVSSTLLFPLARLAKAFAAPLRRVSPQGYMRIMRTLTSHQSKMDRIVNENAALIEAASSGAEGKLFLDCGVNEGLVLKQYMKKLSGFEFIGFEIQRELVEVSRKNNPKAKIIHKAVSNKSETLQMYLPKSYFQNFRGGTSIESNKVAESDLLEKRDVDAIRLLDFLNEQAKLGYDFIAVKMDIEGTEYKIIDDLMENFEAKNNVPIDFLMIEYHPEVLAEPGMQAAYERKLETMGVKVSRWV